MQKRKIINVETDRIRTFINEKVSFPGEVHKMN